MKCRNVNENDNSAIFLGSSKANWPKVLRFEIIADSGLYHVFDDVSLDYTNQNDTYEKFVELEIEPGNIYTSEVQITILGTNRDDDYIYDKSINNFLYISGFDSDDVDFDNVIVHFIDDKNNDYYQTAMEIVEGETHELEMIIPMYSTKKDNYVEDAEAVRCALIQKLSIFKRELWFSIKYGLPLFDKTTNGIFDAYIAMIISEQRGVKDIISFNSKVDKHHYKVDFEVNSQYGLLSVEINN